MFSSTLKLITSLLTGRLLSKIVAYLAALAIFGLCLMVISQRNQAKVLNEIKALTLIDPLPKARALVADGKYCDALQYLDYFREYQYVRDNHEVTDFYNKIKAERDSWWFSLRDAFQGVWSGKGACFESMLTATVSDFFLVGDLRDLILEGAKKYRGEEADEFVVTLASVGILLSGATYVTSGAAGSAKGSLSMVKLAKRLNKVKEPLQKELVDLFKATARLGTLKQLEPLAESVYKMSKVRGLRVKDTMELISHSRKISDLATMGKVAEAYGAKTGKLLRLGGEAPINAFRKFGADKALVRAVDEAIPYGTKGLRMVERVGPSAFMAYLRLAKYGVRAGRSLWQQRLLSLSAWLLDRLPESAIIAIAALSGIVVLGVPARALSLRIRRIRAAT